MLQDGSFLPTRTFTVHVDGTPHSASVDCRVVHTLRDVLVSILPPPPSLLASSAPSGKRTASWLDHCVCTFAGQRLSLTTPSEVAPLDLHVNWEAVKPTSHEMAKASKGRHNNNNNNNTNNHSHTSITNHAVSSFSRKRRSRSSTESIKREYVEEEEEDEEDNKRMHNDDSSEDEYNFLPRPYRPYVEHARAVHGNAQPHTPHHQYLQDDTDEEAEEEEEEKEEENSSNDAHHDSCHASVSARDVVLPIIVGGVVRLINTESRDKSHQWTVYVRGLFNDSQYLTECIESVRFILDPSFTPCERVITSAPFELTEVGWGEFVVKMKIQLRHYPRPLRLVVSNGPNGDIHVPSAASLLSANIALPLAGFARGPILSPVVDLLSRRHRRSTAASVPKRSSNPNSNTPHETQTDGVQTKLESAPLAAEGFCPDVTLPHTPVGGETALELESPGVVMLSHLLRFSHRPRRAHCIPPLGRPFEAEEHIGYALVQTPVVTEQYDEIVIPDPPAALRGFAAALPDLLRQRIAIAKSVASTGGAPVQDGGTPTGTACVESLTAGGVSCWQYIKQDETDDAALAESYLDSVGLPLVPTQRMTAGVEANTLPSDEGKAAATTMGFAVGAYTADPAALLSCKPGRGRRKLTGAEIDLAALRTAKRGLLEAIEKMRREMALRQSTQIYQHYA